MAANPIQPDPYLERAAAHLAELNGQLSAPELAFAAEAYTREHLPRSIPAAEIDAVLKIPGQKPLNITLSVFGRFTKARKGGHEPGERAYEPDDPAGFVMHSIMIGETDIAGDLGQAGEDAVTAYVMENCE